MIGSSQQLECIVRCMLAWLLASKSDAQQLLTSSGSTACLKKMCRSQSQQQLQGAIHMQHYGPISVAASGVQ
jgi:hypothetical protein